MGTETTPPYPRLGLRAGDLVEVRSLAEILATLDARGALDALPFMPEMIASCGKRFRVSKSAHKACDRVEKSGLRRMEDTVHLEDLRCDGASHGGCQAACLIFWKEAWLRRVPEGAAAAVTPAAASSAAVTATAAPSAAARSAPAAGGAATPDTRTMFAATRAPSDPAAPEEARWSCQATEMYRATFPMKWWHPRQYFRDIRSGNATFGQVIRWLLIRSLNQVQRIPKTYKIVETVRGGFRYPPVEGTLKKTPRATLDLLPGDRVRVKPPEEIRATLDLRARNRGLSFDMEMVRYCGGTYQVHSRVTRLIDEPTGRMMEPPNDCIILDEVVCTAEYHGLCPRAIYPYWREIWLERAGEVREAAEVPATAAEVPVTAVAGVPLTVPIDESCGQVTGKDSRGDED